MRSIFVISILVFSNILFSQSYKLSVKVEGLKSTKGNLVVGVYNNSTDFLKKEFTGKTIPITAKIVKVYFNNLPKGKYAIAIYHDENKDGKLTTNFIGLPKEDYAFSNNAMGLIGPPGFEKAAVNMDRNKLIIIKL